MVASEQEDDAPKKRRKRGTTNPLSRARGNQQQPDQIWFRRSGAGYHLFLEYYAGQPTACVAAGVDHKNSKEELTLEKKNKSSTTLQKAYAGAGQSRAAKRRQKRKNKGAKPQPENQSKLPEDDQVEQDVNNDNKSILDGENEEIHIELDHPLWQALQQKISNQKDNQSADYHVLKPCIRALVQPLPLTFRLRACLSPSQRDALQRVIEERFSTLLQPLLLGHTASLVSDNNQPNKVPPSMIYQGRHQLSKTRLSKTHPNLHQFLLEHSQNGTLARQELGSMLPVLALAQLGCFKDAKCRGLDLCASPGSKTLQALEQGGRVVANDVSPARFQALQDAVQRSGIANQDRIGYTCQDATQWTAPNGKNKPWQVIICDVPCSGDGTIRKDKHILPMWKPALGHALHTTQLQILTRALQLLAIGGVVSYSTCSLNPIENEAVVAAALTQFNNQQAALPTNDKHTNKPAIELIDFPKLEGFHRRPGISTWSVADIYQEQSGSKKQKTSTATDNINENGSDDEDDEIPRLQWFDKYDDAVAAQMDHAVPSMWPPPFSSEQHLDRCTRLWPQDHDSGGFFVALLRRNW